MSALPLVMRLWQSVLAVVCLSLLWHAACKVFQIPEYILPLPLAVVNGFAEYRTILSQNGTFSFLVTISGLVIGCACGVVVGAFASENDLVRKVVSPIVVAIQSVPKLALAPILLLWFGYGLFPKVLLVAVSTLFPMLVGTVAGFDSVDPNHIDLMRSLHASRSEILLKVKIPSAMPSMISGLKIAATGAIVAAIVAEWVGSSSGLGYVMLLANSQLNTVLLFDALLLLSGFGVALIGAVAVLEAVVLSWRPPISGSPNHRLGGVNVA